MDWIVHRPLLAAGLGVFLAAFVVSRLLLNGLIEGLDDSQKLRLVASGRRSPLWLAAFAACALAALLWPRAGMVAMAGYFAVATGVRLHWLRGQDFPAGFLRRASLGGWVLVGGFVALAVAVQV